MKFTTVLALAVGAAALPHQVRNTNTEPECKTCKQGNCESYENNVDAALSYYAHDNGKYCDGKQCEQCPPPEESEKISESTENTAEKRNTNSEPECKTCKQGNCESYENNVDAALSYYAHDNGKYCNGKQCEQCPPPEESEEITENTVEKRNTNTEECCGCECECDCFDGNNGCCSGYCCENESVDNAASSAKSAVESTEESGDDATSSVASAADEAAPETEQVEAATEAVPQTEQAKAGADSLVDNVKANSPVKRDYQFSNKSPNYFEDNKILDVLGSDAEKEAEEATGPKKSTAALEKARQRTRPATDSE